jgi:hypothetical protein
MALVPFGGKSKPAAYSGASGPDSKTRMPKNLSTPALERDSGPDASITMPAPEVDGLLRGHDTNYPRKPKQRT